MPSPCTWDQDVPKTQEGEGPVAQGQWRGIQPGHLQDHGQLWGEEAAPADQPKPTAPLQPSGSERTFSRVAESAGPVATSTMILFPL